MTEIGSNSEKQRKKAHTLMWKIRQWIGENNIFQYNTHFIILSHYLIVTLNKIISLTTVERNLKRDKPLFTYETAPLPFAKRSEGTIQTSK